MYTSKWSSWMEKWKKLLEYDEPFLEYDSPMMLLSLTFHLSFGSISCCWNFRKQSHSFGCFSFAFFVLTPLQETDYVKYEAPSLRCCTFPVWLRWWVFVSLDQNGGDFCLSFSLLTQLRSPECEPIPTADCDFLLRHLGLCKSLWEHHLWWP